VSGGCTPRADLRVKAEDEKHQNDSDDGDRDDERDILISTVPPARYKRRRWNLVDSATAQAVH